MKLLQTFGSFKGFKARLVAVIVCLVVAVSVQMVVTYNTVSELRGISDSINLYGKGRFLAADLRYSANALFDDALSDKEPILERINQLINDINKRFDILLNGDDTLGIPATTDSRVLERLKRGQEQWKQQTSPFVEKLLEMRNADESRELLREIDSQVGEFIDRIEATIDFYSDVSEQNINDAINLQIAFISVYGAIAILFFLISLPLFSKINQVVSSLGAGSSEILASTSQQAASTREQSAAVTQTLSTVEELLQSANQSAQRAKTVSASADQASENGQLGREAVENCISVMGAVNSQADDIAAKILDLAEQAQSVGGIVEAVSDIAEQTNLLAINAGIEAARAGEAGAGFGVVAQEIKLLADESKRSTVEIRRILESIQEATNSSVLAMEEGNKRIRETVEQANRAGEVIHALAENISENATAAAQISAASGQQVNAISQIQQAMKDVSEASTQMVNATQQNEQVAKSLADLGTRLKAMLNG